MSNTEFCYLAFLEVFFKVSLVEYGYLEGVWVIRIFHKCVIAGTYLFREVYIFWCLNS